jgi:hypothetical protein
MLLFVSLSIMLGFDSFVISFALEPLVRRDTRYAVAAAFGIFDAAAFALSHLLESPTLNALAHSPNLALPVLMIGYGLYVTATARKATPLASNSAGWVLLPIAASLDNLVAGSIVGGVVPLWFDAAVMAVVSAMMSLAGLVLSEILRQRLDIGSGPFVVGSWIIGSALLIVVG